MKILINESSFIRLFETTNLSDIYQKYYSNIPQDDFNEIISSDPTWNRDKPNKMGKYGKWLLSLYLSKKLKLEDLYKAKDYLSYFIKYNNVIDNKDINTYKSLNDLYSVVSNFIENPDQATSKQDAIRKIKEGAEKVYEDDEWLVIIPHTEESSCYYGKGTQWCTAADKGSNMFKSYNDSGNLYINIDKKNKRKYQFHFESDSFMDETDYPIDEPIYETIGFNNNILKWYKTNVNDWEKLCEYKLTIIPSDDDSDIVLKRTIGEKYWRLYIIGYENPIASDLIIDDDTDTNVYNEMLLNNYYAIFKNAYGYLSLVSYDYTTHNIYLVGDKFKYIDSIGDIDYGYSHVVTIDRNNTYRIISIPNNFNIYVNKNANDISKSKYINNDIIAVFKNNGLVDLVNDDNEIDDVRLINGEIETEEGDYEYGTVLNSYGEKITINLDTLDIDENYT